MPLPHQTARRLRSLMTQNGMNLTPK